MPTIFLRNSYRFNTNRKESCCTLCSNSLFRFWHNRSSRDYRHKRSEYAARGIGEYWIIDPILGRVTVLEWVDGFYEEQVYESEQIIISPIFAELKLTAFQILQQS